MDGNGVLKTVLAQTLGSRYVFLPAYRFHRDPESLVIQPVTNLRKVVGCLEVVRPATNDSRTPSKADRDAFLHWAMAKDLAQPMLDVCDCFLAYPDFGRQTSGFSNIYRDVESQEVVPVSHVGYPGLFGRQFEPAGFPKKVADLVLEPFRVLPITAREKHAPIIGITAEPGIGQAMAVPHNPGVAVLSLGMEEPVQLVQHDIGQER